MAGRSNASADSVQRELTITRIFDAPRELVFKAWTDPKHVAQWWGPKGFTKESPQNNLYFLTAGNRVVPLWMEAVWPQFQTLHVVVGDRQSGLIQPRIELGAKPQPSLGRGRTDEIDYGFVANQRLAFPVHADEREHAVLDLVPLASSRGVMAYGDAQALVVGQLL